MGHFSFKGIIVLLVLGSLGQASERKLQDVGPRHICNVREFNPDRRKSHVLVNLDKDGDVLLRWVNPNRTALTIDVDEGNVAYLNGVVVPDHPDYGEDQYLVLDFTFYIREHFAGDYTTCFCASDFFLPDPNNPGYGMIQRSCNLQNYRARPPAAQDVFFCPTCEENECRRPAKNPMAPNPIYRDWIFYDGFEGNITGPGLRLFREKIAEGFKKYRLDACETCTPDVTNMPLPQVGCSGWDSSLPRGFGVNGKDQDCGMSMWFNCQEDVQALGGEDINVRVADINADFIDCETVED